ncbi:hypothetical protein [Sphingomicrobium lutaoense]|uniref:Uncharacterized protein n=1 Tax=Sphingomicrobium lutaoense TaxID=515949 RepID=A0A839YZ81_9SPHN|nr:hypothetical protein [Sphingomicrobium lutaoense]MBB3764439.1 hypothetical protein [Sphingomicrobium lutaoense]
MTALWLAALAAQGAVATPPGNYEALPPGEVDLRPDAVGPESLRDFNLGGERQSPPPPAPREPAPQPRASQPVPPPVQPAPRQAPPVTPTRMPEPPAVESGPRPDAAPATATPAPPTEIMTETAPAPATSAPVLPPPARVDLPGVPQDQGPPSWMWAIVGLLALLIGYAIFRSRRPVPAAGPTEAPVPLQRASSSDTGSSKPAAAREPAPAAPAPAPPPPPAPSSEGFVGIKQAPDLLLDLTPLRAALTEEEFSIDYAVTMANRGTGPALDIGIDSAMVMAGPQQEQKIAEFIAHPPAEGKVALQMLNSHGQAQLRGTIRLPIAQMTVIPLEGRQLIMPTLVLLPRHRHGRGKPARFVIGRKPREGDKLAPMRADLGPRSWRDLMAKKA